MDMNEIKRLLEEFINLSLSQGIRKANIEIELIHHIKRCLKAEED